MRGMNSYRTHTPGFLDESPGEQGSRCQVPNQEEPAVPLLRGHASTVENSLAVTSTFQY